MTVLWVHVAVRGWLSVLSALMTLAEGVCAVRAHVRLDIRHRLDLMCTQHVGDDEHAVMLGFAGRNHFCLKAALLATHCFTF